MPPSPVVQATQEAIESLHATSGVWGLLFGLEPGRPQLEAQAEAVAAVFLAFSVAYDSLPRFRTEPALRRFMEALHELERSTKALRIPVVARPIEEVQVAAARAARQAEAAFAALSGKPVEVQDSARPVQGSVSKLLGDRGYGFVRATGGTSEVFFTAQSIRGARFSELRVGQNVTFRIVPDPRVPGRMHAIELQPVR